MKNKLTLVVMSDTHTRHREFIDIPDGDVLIHAGDIMNSGYEFDEVEDFADWFSNFTHPTKIMIAGNHDILFDDDYPGKSLKKYTAIDCENVLKDSGIIYLNDSGIEVDGVKFWGSPVQPFFCNWGFNRRRGEDINKHWKLIPDDTEVLITHGPSFGIRDLVTASGSINNGQHVGCEALKQHMDTRLTELKAHIFGHIHDMSGVYEERGVVHVNAAVLDDRYRVRYAPKVVYIK